MLIGIKMALEDLALNVWRFQGVIQRETPELDTTEMFMDATAN